MAHTWTPEELEELEARIKAARAGDVVKASGLLHLAASCLDNENEMPPPEPLRRYLIAAFNEITKYTDRVHPPYPTPKNLAEMKKNARYFKEQFEEPRDANAALNLKHPRGRKRSKIRVELESLYIGLAVTEEMEKEGKSVEAAVEAVAEKMGISERTVARARKNWKQQLAPPKVDDSK